MILPSQGGLSAFFLTLTKNLQPSQALLTYCRHASVKGLMLKKKLFEKNDHENIIYKILYLDYKLFSI